MPGFSGLVRSELLKTLPEKPCCLQSELNALTQGYGVILLKGGGRFQVRYRLPDGDTARMVFLLLKRRLGMTPAISFHLEPRFRKRRLIELTINEYDAKRLLLTLHMFDPKTGLRGLFIARGHARDPETAYLIEYAMDSEERAETLVQLLRQSDIEPRTRQRGGEHVVYVERGDEVRDLLALMSAHQALFALEDARIRRSAGGTANRQTNCDTANTGRLLSAAQRQYDSIEAWERTDRPAVECELRYNQSQDIRTEYLQTDYLETRDKYAVFLGGNYALVEISTNANTGRRLLMIKDSYAHCFTPFLLGQFDELDLVDIRYFSQSLSEYMEQGNYTDVLFLYNAAGFAEDASLVKLQY